MQTIPAVQLYLTIAESELIPFCNIDKAQYLLFKASPLQASDLISNFLNTRPYPLVTS